jgi:2-polyprenyl-3-methyl-5-hydroxy-6-metoxy-1,4-benzoquinol methylase
MTDPRPFYAGLTQLYHLIYEDWDASMQRQATALDAILREVWGAGRVSVLDLSCGIGTQALGLAKLGYAVTASDLSPAEVARARAEAGNR